MTRIEALAIVAALVVGMAACGRAPAGPPVATPDSTAGLIPSATAGPGSPQTPTDLKYILIAVVGEPFFCDPDYYPVARADEAELAASWFAEVDQTSEEFTSILRHLGLADPAELSTEQQLLVYREHKKLSVIALGAMGETYRFEYRISEAEAGFVVQGIIDRTGRVEIEQKESTFNTCPICLAGDTLIDTPRGPIPVRDLRVGMSVWTLDRSGARVMGTISRTGQVRVPAGHAMVRILLGDGRELVASPGHPMADGRGLGLLRAGDQLEGVLVVRVERADWHGTSTYDILPSGETGLYWANGVLLRSTLAAVGWEPAIESALRVTG